MNKMSDTRIDFLYLSEEDMIKAGVTDMAACIETMEEMFRLMKAGNYRMGGANGNSHGSMIQFPAEPAFPEMPADGPDRRFMAMPAYIGGMFDMAGMKWYGSNMENKKKGLPRSILMLTLNDKDTGAPLAFMSANLLSSMRTGAIPGVGFKLFARQDADTLAILGPGNVSKAAFLAAMAARPTIRTVKIKGRGAASLERFLSFAREYYPDLEYRCAETIEEAVRDADIVSGAVPAAKPDPAYYPYIDETWLKPGAVVESAEAMRFDDDFLIHRARIVTDNVMLYEAWEEEYRPHAYATVPIPGVRVEELITEGRMSADQVDDIGDILLGNAPVHRREGEIVVYSIGGMPTEDVAWGTMVYRRALEQGIGTKLKLWDMPQMM